MPNLAGKRAGMRRKLAGLIAAGGILLAAAAYLRQPAADAPSVGTFSAHASSNRFGPGNWIEPAPPTPPPVAPLEADTLPPDGLATTADRHLVVNKALHDVIDYFLLGGLPGQRASHVAKLLAYLKASLPQAAYTEAAQIVRNYLTYLEAHDQLLARESIPAPTPESGAPPMDLDRITAWVAQRARLRQSILGIQVAQVWYDDDEAQTQQTLLAMRQRGIGSTQAITVDTDPLQRGANALLAMRVKGASQETQRAHIAGQFGEPAAQRFDALESEERAWQARFAQYRSAADRITRQSDIAPAERTRQIEILLAQTFPSDPERLRARALGAN